MKVLEKIGISVLIVLFITIGLCYGQSGAMQHLIKGVDYAAQGKFKEAKEEFDRALKADPFLEAAKRVLKVIEDVNDKKIESETAIHFFKGAAYYYKKQFGEAIAEYTGAIELNRRFYYAYYARGVAWAMKGDLERAVVDYNKALEINPSLAEAYILRGYAWSKKGDLDRAIADCNKGIELNPRDTWWAYVFRGTAWARKGDLDRAIAGWTKTIEIIPR